MLTIVHEFPCALYGDTELHESIYHMVVALHYRMKHLWDNIPIYARGETWNMLIVSKEAIMHAWAEQGG